MLCCAGTTRYDQRVVRRTASACAPTLMNKEAVLRPSATKTVSSSSGQSCCCDSTARSLEKSVDARSRPPTAVLAEVPACLERAIEVIPSKLYWVACMERPKAPGMPFFADFGPLDLGSTYRYCLKLIDLVRCPLDLRDAFCLLAQRTV